MSSIYCSQRQSLSLLSSSSYDEDKAGMKNDDLESYNAAASTNNCTIPIGSSNHVHIDSHMLKPSCDLFYDARQELDDSSTSHDSQKKVVRFADEMGQSLYPWYDEDGRYCNNTKIVSSQEYSARVLDIYDEAHDCPHFGGGHTPGNHYCKAKFYKAMYTDTDDFEDEGEEEDDEPKSKWKRNLFYTAVTYIASTIYKSLSNRFNGSEGEGEGDDENKTILGEKVVAEEVSANGLYSATSVQSTSSTISALNVAHMPTSCATSPTTNLNSLNAIRSGVSSTLSSVSKASSSATGITNATVISTNASIASSIASSMTGSASASTFTSSPSMALSAAVEASRSSPVTPACVATTTAGVVKIKNSTTTAATAGDAVAATQ